MPEDVRAEILEAEKRGVFLPLNSYEAMAAASTNKAALRGYKRQARKALDIYNTPFAAAERLNRLVTWIAAHRLAKSADVRNKIKSVLSSDALARKEVLEGDDAGLLGRFSDHTTYATQFFMSRLNRPRIGRGYGTLAFQFKG